MKTLIVEDDYLARSLLSSMLSEYGICDYAVNGQEALEKIAVAMSAEDPYDLICLDIMMPVLDGQQTLTKLRKLEKQAGITQNNRVKVIMVTAIDNEENIIQAFKDGKCDAYLTKPVDRTKLIININQLGLID